MKSLLSACLLWCLLLVARSHGSVPSEVKSLDLTVDGVPRHALLYVPENLSKDGTRVPLVFVFHGHGSDPVDAIGGFGINRLWPEAISVYPQGLPIPSITDPQGVRSGWQHEVGGVGNRDLRFFDALLARLESDYPVDTKRIYATGHSNGGSFTYLLWLVRPEVFAAFAPCSAAPKFVAELKPKPAMISGGKSDPIVPFAHTRAEAEAVWKLDDCSDDGVAWEGGDTVLFHSARHTPLVTYFYEGGHGMTAEEPKLIVEFFRQLLIQ